MLHLRHSATRSSNLIGAWRRGLMRRYTPPDHPSLKPVVRPAEVNGHWMTSSTPSACTTRTCATPYRTVGISSTPLDTTNRSSLYHLPHLEEGLASPDSLSSKKGEGAEHSRVLTGRSTSSSEDIEHMRKGGSKSSTTDRSWRQPPVPRSLLVVGARNNLHLSGSMAQLRPPRQVPAPRRSSDPREPGEESTNGWGSSINITFPRTLLALGVALKDLTESDTPFFDIVPTEGEYPLGHIYMPLTFGTPENYRTEFLRFKVARFDYGYNAIIGRPGLAEFMAIPHYSYMILKMSGPQGIITMHADFQGAAECFRGAIQAALTAWPPTAPPAQAYTKSEEGLTIPTNEAQAVTSIRPTEETKRINLGFTNERKTTIISSSLDDK
jgi:hypothetical protein